MPFALTTAEPLPDGVRRVAAEELDAALADLAGDASDGWDEAVHDARKRMKKTRALARLVRPVLGGHYPTVNAGCRDAAGLLSEARDAEVLLETFDSVAETVAAAVGAPCADRVRTALAEHRAAGRDRLPPGAPAVRRATGIVAALRADVDTWPVRAVNARVLGGGVGRVFGRGRTEFGLAYRSGSPEAFHEWRKRVKYLWYQLRLVEQGWPAVLSPLVAACDELADLLGREHDLTVLAEAAGGRSDVALPLREHQRGAVLALLGEARDRLRVAARPLAGRVYAESPADLARRVGVYLDSARAAPVR